MKKHDDGYVLPYVMVIMTVLALVASFIMASSLRNLQSQQASIQRMESQYTAAGEIEKVVALLENEISPADIAAMYEGSENVRFDADTLEMTVTEGDVEIRCVFELNGTVYSYVSYEISTVTPAEGEVGGE